LPRLLGVDAGEERVGLAVCDAEGLLAVPLGIIERKGRGLDWTAGVIAEHARSSGVEGIVVGLPLNMDGSFGPQAAKARALGRRAAAAAGLAVEFQDERMSSFIAEQRLQSVHRQGRGRRRQHVDDLAAAVILQSFLDGRRGASDPGERQG